MICFPNAKINLGLNIINKRDDGFHNIETIFYPVGWNEPLEVIVNPNSSSEFNLHLSGIHINGNITDNLLFKAYNLIKKLKPLPHIDVYLHKCLPMGAGLGGGSSDAAFFINLLNQQFKLELTDVDKIAIAIQLGSDCAFFIKNNPVFACQKGDILKNINLNLSAYYITIIYPNVHSNTQIAYSLVKPKKPKLAILDVIQQPIHTWKNDLVNDFEISIFDRYPIVEKIKNDLYESGALYASMSGSGSAVFGLFEKKPTINFIAEFPHWSGKML